MIDGLKVVDFHTHIGVVKGVYGTMEWTPEQLVSRMDDNGIDFSVTFSHGSGIVTPSDFTRVNDYVLDAVRKFPTRLAGFCMTTPTHKDEALKEIRRCAAKGMKGVKLLPTRHGYYALDNAILDPIAELAGQLGMLILAHTDSTDQVSTPDNLRRLALRHPNVTFIGAHFGLSPNWCHWVPEIVKDASNIVLDSSATPNIPGVIFVESIRVLGEERVVFGTDCNSMLAPEVELAKIHVAEKYHGLTKRAKQKILGQNAIRLLGLDL